MDFWYVEDREEPISDDVSNCFCGAKASVNDLNGAWRVTCDCQHSLTKRCGTKNKAIDKWNYRVERALEYGKKDAGFRMAWFKR